MAELSGNTPQTNPLIQSVVSVQGQELLAILTGFIQSISNLHVPSSGKDYAVNADNIHTATQLHDGFEVLGQQVVGTLEKFIQAIINPHCLNHSDRGSPSDHGLADINEYVVASPISTLSPTRQIIGNDSTQGQWALDLVRRHVFNKMPIRLLTFDSNGSGVEIIERAEVLRRLEDAFHEEIPQLKHNFPREWKNTVIVKDFIERRARYAILSHTWIRDTPGDVIYRDLKSRNLNPRGNAKITNFCHAAAQNHGVTLAWMDTVCINKESSSELDESIRSMFKWYRGAYVCLIYLSETLSRENAHRDCWFTRGWTLQELLAPKDVEFYSMNWEPLFRRPPDMETLPFSRLNVQTNVEIQRQIYKATTITEHELELCKQGEIERIPISRRMQLASRRNVTRDEDTAYSLMGILGIDITIAYGEGHKRAFFRLVRELLTCKKDILDLFNRPMRPTDQLIPSTILLYRYRSSVFDVTGEEKPSKLDQWQPLEPIIFTHLGVRIPLLLVPALLRVQNNFNSYLTLPYGDFFGMGSMPGAEYDLLDNRIFSDEQITTRVDNQSGNRSYPLVATFGILNFGGENDNILLPQQCLSVPLDCGVLKVGCVGPSDNITIIKQANPLVFQLKSTRRKYKIPKDGLGMHGIQLVTLYL